MKLSDLQQKLHQETASIAWHDLQTFFARGQVLLLAADQDLPKVAEMIANDQADKIKNLQQSKQLAPPSNDQARQWYQKNISLWAVVIAPFVLVQEQ